MPLVIKEKHPKNLVSVVVCAKNIVSKEHEEPVGINLHDMLLYRLKPPVLSNKFAVEKIEFYFFNFIVIKIKNNGSTIN